MPEVSGLAFSHVNLDGIDNILIVTLVVLIIVIIAANERLTRNKTVFLCVALLFYLLWGSIVLIYLRGTWLFWVLLAAWPLIIRYDLGGAFREVISDPIMEAIRSGDLTKVLMILTRNSWLLNCRDEDSRTPLHCAINSTYPEIADLLLSRGAMVNARDSRGNTPLHKITSRCQEEMARLLIDFGADLNAKGEAGTTPLHCAIRYGRLSAARILIERGADANIRDSEWNTPLHTASKGVEHQGGVDQHSEPYLYYLESERLLDLIEMLIPESSDINACNYQGETALSIASAQGHRGIIDLLRRHGATG